MKSMIERSSLRLCKKPTGLGFKKQVNFLCVLSSGFGRKEDFFADATAKFHLFSNTSQIPALNKTLS